MDDSYHRALQVLQFLFAWANILLVPLIARARQPV